MSGLPCQKHTFCWLNPLTWPPPSVDFVWTRARFLQPLDGFITWKHLLKRLMLSFLLGRAVLTFLFITDDYKLSQSCMRGAKLSMFTFTSRNTLVHRSCWAGQATNESQGWVNNQLPPLTLSVTTKPVDWLYWKLFTLGIKLPFWHCWWCQFCISVWKPCVRVWDQH